MRRLLHYMFTSICRKMIKHNREKNVWPALHDILLVDLLFKKMSIRKLILNQSGLPSITKGELKTIAICHVTAENAAVCVTKVGHANAVSIKKIKEKKEIEETEGSYR